MSGRLDLAGWQLWLKAQRRCERNKDVCICKHRHFQRTRTGDVTTNKAIGRDDEGFKACDAHTRQSRRESRNSRVACSGLDGTESRARCRKVGASTSKAPWTWTLALHLTSFARYLHLCTLALSCRFLFYFVHRSNILLCRSFLCISPRLAFPPLFCLFPKHPQRSSPAFSTFQLPAAPYYAADIQHKRSCLATGLITSRLFNCVVFDFTHTRYIHLPKFSLDIHTRNTSSLIATRIWLRTPESLKVWKLDIA